MASKRLVAANVAPESGLDWNAARARQFLEQAIENPPIQVDGLACEIAQVRAAFRA